MVNSDFFLFFLVAYPVRIYDQSGWSFFFSFFFAPLPNREMQGISPTLLYPVPTREESWLLSKIIHSVRDYYPLWQVCFLLVLISTYAYLFKSIQPPNSSYTKVPCSCPVRRSLSVSLRSPGDGSRSLRLCRRRFWRCWGWKLGWVCLGGGVIMVAVRCGKKA